MPWHHQPTSPRAGHPALLVQTPAAPLQAACVELVLCLPLHDLLLQHIALVLQATVAVEDVAGQLYDAALAEALVGHVLRRYAAARPAQRAATGGFAPYKLRRTLAYIQAHLEEPVSLTTLAAVAQMSTTHFAHLFKEATGLPPHQYVLRCRMGHAKRLLADTDMPLIMDQSHFTALFSDARRHDPQSLQKPHERAVRVGAAAASGPCGTDGLRWCGCPQGTVRRPQADPPPSRRCSATACGCCPVAGLSVCGLYADGGSWHAVGASWGTHKYSVQELILQL